MLAALSAELAKAAKACVPCGEECDRTVCSSSILLILLMVPASVLGAG